MILKEGKITLKELSEWFGLAPNGLTKNPKSKAKKFEILKSYADYHFEGKVLYIDKVYIEEYSKAYPKIKTEYRKRWGMAKDDKGQINQEMKINHIDTCARVGSDIWYNNPDIKAQISLPTAKRYVNRAKVEDFGHNYLDDKGAIGSSRSVQMDEDGKKVLDENQLEIVRWCRQTAYAELSNQIAEIDELYHSGEISKKERDEAVGAIDTKQQYDKYIDLLIEKLGFVPEKRTQLVYEIEFEK